jgi:hypothetical protein
VDKILPVDKVCKGDSYLHGGDLYSVEQVRREEGWVTLTLAGYGEVDVSKGRLGAVRRLVRCRPPAGRLSVGLGQMERDWIMSEAAEQDCTAAEIIRQALFLYRTARQEKDRHEQRRRRWAWLLPRRGRAAA